MKQPMREKDSHTMDKENERESQSDNTHLSTIAYIMRQKRERRVERAREREEKKI